MGIKHVKVLRHECDGCGKVILAESPDEVLGLGGKVWEVNDNGGTAAEWFACQRPCVTKAIGKALEKAWS